MRAQAGFTLVELAIVMIIIGLLIARVLKGQALIHDARVTSTVAQTKAIEAATTTFRDTYNFIPGDMTNPTVRLPNCLIAPCSNAGNGDAKLAFTPAAAPNGENQAFFPQLYVASLMTGLQPGPAAARHSVVTCPKQKFRVSASGLALPTFRRSQAISEAT
jgi:prepilin-type N-terminal cleavage/methylation domain-containing protein